MGASGKWPAVAQSPCSGGCWWTGTTGVAFLGMPPESSLSVVTQRYMLSVWQNRQHVCCQQIGKIAALKLRLCAAQVSTSTNSREGEDLLQILLHKQAQGNSPDASLSCRVIQPIRPQI